MKCAIIAIGAGAALCNALATRGGCQFHLSVASSITGPVGEASSGQAIAGSGVTAATFTLNGNEIWDSQGRGCWWTPPTHTLQCDNNQNPAAGFAIDCNGGVSFNGQTTFFECDAGNGVFDIYLQNGQGVNCNPVTLSADGCHASCAPPPPPKQCQTDLSGTYEFPHLIVPIDSANPTTASGTSYNGEVTSTISSLFNFDIPTSDSGKTCSLVFLFPNQSQLQTSSYTFSGNGGLDFAELSAPATQSTTYDTRPSVAHDFGTTVVSPGNSYNIATFSCPAGQTIGFEISAAGDTCLNYFQDYNPSPIGLYITVC